MKPISASIIVLAAACLILGGSFIAHSDTKLFVLVVGWGIGAVGMWGWIACIKDKKGIAT